MADILDGTYDYQSAAISVLQGGQLSSTQIARLNDLRVRLLGAEPASNDQISNDVVEAISAVSPALGAAAKMLQQNKLGVAALIIVIFLLLKQCGLEKGGLTLDISNHTTIQNVINVTEVYRDKSKDSLQAEQQHSTANSNTAANSSDTGEQ